MKTIRLAAITLFAFTLLSALTLRNASLQTIAPTNRSGVPPALLKTTGSTRMISLLPPLGTITVNTTAQSPGVSGDCTLGEAIQAANQNVAIDGCSAGAGTDTIILPPGTYTLTTTDASFPATGLPAITSDIIIQGAGNANTIIERDPNAASQFRLLALSNANAGSLVLNDVTMRGGRSDDIGGALYLARATTLNNVVLSDNTAPNGGGAIVGGPVVINNCTFNNNRATNYYGGAIYGAILTIAGTTFTGNQAAVGGGAVFYNQSAGARVTISNSTFSNNTATTNNGGAILTSGVTVISNSLFDGNNAGSDGGAIFAALFLQITDSVVINNHANEKGGITREPVPTILGGGFESLTINRCNISNNTSNRTAGGLSVQSGTANISNSTISGNMAGLDGGGIFDTDATLNLTNDTFDGNTAVRGGGVYYQDGTETKPLTANNVTISSNHATNYGGGLFRNSGIVKLKNTIIALNSADSGFALDLYEANSGITSLGYNFIGIKEPSTFTNAVGDQTGTLAAPIDPLLDVLQNNGGPTFTRALLAESTAANAGNPAAPGSGGDSCAPTDQRGRRRPDGIRNSVGRCDIGAFEAAGPITCLTPPSGMVAWWDGDNTANDISGNHNDGTLQNGAGFAPGKVGQSFKFDGVDDFASITNNTSLDVGTGDFTIDLWVKLDSLLTDQMLFDKISGTGSSVNDPSYFVEFDQSNALRFRIGEGLSVTNDLIVPTSLLAGVWYHVAAVRSGNTGTLYLDGELLGSQTAGNNINTGTGGFAAIGKCLSDGGCVRFFNGRIDELEIFDRALSQTEIQSIYDADSVGKCKPSPSASPTPTPPAGAIIVNSTAQSPGISGDCTLGEAIQAANTDMPVDGCSAGSGTDTIILPAGTYTLSTVDNDDHAFVGATGLPGIHTDVIIQGAGRSTTIIERDPSAALSFRLMAINSQSVGTLVLNDLTMRGGLSKVGENGGALYTFDRPATLNNVDFINNRSVQGGALAGFNGGVFEINNCTFTNNHADAFGNQAGAIFGAGLTIRNSTFTGNTAEHGGGAILTAGHGAVVNISDSVFLNNSAMNEGGALLSYGTVTIVRTTFDGNSTTAHAGAMSVAGNVKISNSTIINNHADADVGGILNATFTGGANVLSVDHCNISNNTSNRFTGGIQIQGTTATVSSSTISGNHALLRGGGLNNGNANLTLTNVTIVGNTVGNINNAGDGGGVYWEDSANGILNNVTITGNSATHLGAGLFHRAGDIKFKNSIVALNDDGGTFGTDVYQNSVPLTSLGYNLIGIKDGANFGNAVGDQTGTGTTPINPLLGPLQDNGGPTLTRALLAGSPAIDAANPAAPGSGGESCASTDQRGRRRPDGIPNGGGRCDIGAFEVAGPVVCDPSPSGLVAWWPFDGNGNDIQGSNHVLIFGSPSFGAGKVDQALSFDGLDDHGRVPASAVLDVGEGNGLTLDMWINPNDNFHAQPLIEWNDGTIFEGVQLWISADFAGFGQGPGSVYLNLEDSDGVFHTMSTAPGLLAANAWQHVAVTYDKVSGVAVIYLNGEVAAQQTLGTFTPRTSTDLYFGYRAVGVEAGRRFAGEMDEVEIFNRALSITEIQAIFDADSAGKCKSSPSPSPTPTPTPPTISINDVSVSELNSGTNPLTFTASLSASSAQTITVNFATADGTATTSDHDYTSTSGTVTFNPGETTKPVVVSITGDTKFEPDETFLVNLSGATNATLGDNQGQGTILNDDSQPTISINDVNQSEGNSGTSSFTFTVTLLNQSSQTVTANYATADGTATAPGDYQSASGAVTFNPGEVSKPVTVSVNGDTTFEPTETFLLNLSNASNATIGDNQGIGTILNDDSAATPTPTPTPVPGPSGNGAIAFATNRDGNREIYVMNPDGAGQTRLTINTASDTEPDWSRDGTKLAFTSNRNGNSDIYKMNADGSSQTRLTTNPAEDSGAAWSPDGSQITFVSGRDGNFEVYRMNADGTNQTRLTNSPADDFDPSWSPDGRHIAFVSGRDGNLEIYTMNPDGTNQVRITTGSAHNFEPEWSPDGSKIAFTRFEEFVFNFELYVMNADGSNQTRLTTGFADDYNPAWSPDGTKLVFTSTRDGNRQLYVMNADGSNQERATNNAMDDFDGNWQAAFTIKGQVRDIGNNGLDGVAVSLSGSQSKSTITDATGNYAFAVQAGGSYTVTPLRNGYTFNPVNQTFNNLSTNQTVNFTASSHTDLSLAVSDAPDPVATLGNITYNFTITNHGPLTASSVLFTQTFAANETFVSITPSQGSCSRAGATLTCTMGSLANGGNATITTVLRAPNSATTVSTTANVSSSEIDPSPADNQVQETTAVQTVTDVSLTETAAPGAVSQGENVVYKIKVQNNGPNSAHAIVITGTTTGLTSVTFNLSAFGSCSPSGSAFTCSLNNAMFNGGNATVTIQGLADGSSTNVTNSAQVTENEIDSNPANNSANVSTTVYKVPNTGNAFLRVTKIVDSAGDPTPRQAGDFLMRVKQGENVEALFPGSSMGTDVGFTLNQPNKVFTVEEANPDSDYLTTFKCDGDRTNLTLNKVKLSAGDTRACTVTNTYLGPRNAGGQANSVLKVIKTVDNTGAPTTKQPSDFTISVKHTGTVIDTSPGAANGVNVGVKADQIVATPFNVVEQPNSDYVGVFGGDCTVTGDVTLKLNETKICTVNNVYVGPHVATQNAILKVFKKVDNFNAPLNQQKAPGDFQLSILDSNNVNLSTFPGSQTGKNVPLAVPTPTPGSFFILEGSHPHFVPTFGDDCQGLSSTVHTGQAFVSLGRGQTKNCTVTNRYVGALDNGGNAERVLEIQTLVDHTGAPAADILAPADFAVRVGNAPAQPGSPAGTYFGLQSDNVAISVRGAMGTGVAAESYEPIFDGACRLLPGTLHSSAHDVSSVRVGEFGLCKITLKYVGTPPFGSGPFRLIELIQLVDNSGAPTPKQSSDFTLTVHGSGFQTSFPGSTNGTALKIADAGFSVSSVSPNGYFTTHAGDCTGASPDIAVCTLTGAYVGSHSAGSSTSAVLKVVNLVNNGGAPTLKQPSDFQIAVKSGPATVATFAGSSNGINVGLNTSAGGVKVEETSGPAGYSISFSGDCTPIGVSISAGESRVCTVTNTYNANPITTPIGSSIAVQSGNVNINFSNVSAEGGTLATQINPAAVGTLPGTFKIADNLAFDITTTASVSAPLTVCFDVPLGVAPTAALFNALQVLHAENGQLVDRTTSRDFATRRICAQTNSLSPFAVVEQIDGSLPSISGRVTDHQGNGVGGLQLNLSGALEQSDTTDSDGNYSFVNLTPGGNYAVAPSGPGYFLTPSEALFNQVNGDQSADFTAVNVQTVQFAPVLNQVFENSGAASVTVLRPTGTQGQVTVDYSTTDDTAHAGTDYTASSGTLTFDDGVASQTISIPINDNALLDGSRTFSLTLSNPSDGLSLSVQNPVAVTILDDDGLSITESGFGRTVTLSNVTVTYSRVMTAGITSAVPIDPNSAGAAPTGYTVTGPAYDITTSATYTAPVNVCFNLPSISDQATFSHLKVLHGELNASNQLVLMDRTTGSDFASRTVCSSVTSLSPFVIAQSSTPTVAQVTISGQLTNNAGDPIAGANVALSGAQSAVTFSDSQGHYSFDNLASGSSYTVSPTFVNYTFAPANRTFSLIGNKLDAFFTGTLDAVPSINPIDTTSFFVRQQYLDFLSREPDAAGFNAWVNVLNNCSDVNNNPSCDRQTVSGSFFGSQEFRLKGSFVYRFYKLAFNRLPAFNEIIDDMNSVTGQTPEDVFAKKAAFTNAFAQRTEFANNYDSLSNALYVSSVMGRYNLSQITTPDPVAPDGTNKVTLTSADLTNRLNASTLTRAQVLRAIADSDQVFAAEFNQSFVAMQYYGYLRRAPELTGYNAWLDYLNAHPGDFHTMINGFVNSIEYRQRFKP